MNCAFHVNLVAAPDAPHDAAEIPEAVNGDHSGFIEWRAKEGAGKMRPVMLDKVNLGCRGANSGGAQVLTGPGNLDEITRARGIPWPISDTGSGPNQLPAKMRTRIARYRDMIRYDVAKAGSRRENWEPGPMLDPIESLLLKRCFQ